MNDFFRHIEMDRRIDAARSDAHGAEVEVIQLKARIHTLETACEGLWELLKFKIGCTDEELNRAVDFVKSRPEPDTCSHCQRKLLVKHATACNWCGRPLERTPFG